MFRRNRILSQWLLFLTVVLLSGCGFQLRGATDLPFQTIYMDMPPNSTLYVELKRYIQANGARVITLKEQAEVVLQVESNRRDKVILTLNTDGRVREHALYQYFQFTLRDNKGRVLQSPPEIALKRDISYNENQELAKTAEEELIYREIQSDLVQRILRLLAGSKATQPQPE